MKDRNTGEAYLDGKRHVWECL